MYDQRIVISIYFPVSLAAIGWGMNVSDSKPIFSSFLIIAGSILLVCSIILFKRNRKISYFPEISIPLLNKWCSKWAGEFEGIKKVTLYDAPISLGADFKYVLLFKFRNSDVGRICKRSFVNSCRMMPDSLFNDHFTEVYNKEPDVNFTDSWYISTNKPEDLNKKFSIVLYNKWI